MSDSTGLMAPIPYRARQEYDERKRREEGLGGLVAEIARPLTFFPHPVINIPATIAENVAREGWAKGILSSWDAIMPAVRNARGVLNVWRKADKPASRSDIARILSKGITSPEAEEFYHDTKTFIDVPGNTLAEIPNVNARATRKYLDELEARVLGVKRGPFKGTASEFLDHPELFGRFPQLRDIPVEVLYNPRASRSAYYHPNTGINMVVSTSPTTTLETFLHELNHAAQHVQGLPSGANSTAILFHLLGAVENGKLPKPAGWDNMNLEQKEQLLSALAKKLYFHSAGEIASRAVEERRALTRAAREASLPTLWGAHPLRGYPDGVPQHMRVVDPNDVDDLARVARLLLTRQGGSR